jgi:hypothetical protein
MVKRGVRRDAEHDTRDACGPLFFGFYFEFINFLPVNKNSR